jgi:hypothetical protein
MGKPMAVHSQEDGEYTDASPRTWEPWLQVPVEMLYNQSCRVTMKLIRQTKSMIIRLASFLNRKMLFRYECLLTG